MIDTSKTVLLKLSFSGLGNSKKISNGQVQVDADKDLISVSKQLLDSPELEAVRSLDGEIRRFLYYTCLPFEGGIHLLPVAMIEDVENKLANYQTKRKELVSLFVSAYPRLCHEAARRLRGLYDPRNYPPRDEINAAFSMAWQYISFDAPQALKAISEDVFNREREKIAAHMEDAYEEARVLLRQTMADLVTHLRERLEAKSDGQAKRLHASTVDSLRQFLETFDYRNITNDAELQAIVTQARQLLNPVRVDALRDSTRYRNEIAQELGRIETAIDANLFSESRRRMVIHDEEEQPALIPA